MVGGSNGPPACLSGSVLDVCIYIYIYIYTHMVPLPLSGSVPDVYIYIYIYLAIDYITTNKAALSLIVYSFISLVLCSRPKIVLHRFCLLVLASCMVSTEEDFNFQPARVQIAHARKRCPLVELRHPLFGLDLFTLDFTPIIHACGWQLQLLFSSVGSIVLLENKEFYELKSMKLPNPTSTIIYIYIYIFQSYLQQFALMK